MASFDSGVASYIKGIAVVFATFPVDHKGNAYVCCAQCRFFSRNSKKCGLNGCICEFPETHIGSYCPLEFEEVDK